MPIINVAVRFPDELSLTKAIEQLAEILEDGSDDALDYTYVGATLNNGEPVPTSAFIAQMLEADI